MLFSSWLLAVTKVGTALDKLHTFFGDSLTRDSLLQGCSNQVQELRAAPLPHLPGSLYSPSPRSPLILPGYRASRP